MLKILLKQLKKLLDAKNYQAAIQSIHICSQLLQLYTKEQLHSISQNDLTKLAESFLEIEQHVKNKEIPLKICQQLMNILHRYNDVKRKILATIEQKIYLKTNQLTPYETEIAKSQNTRFSQVGTSHFDLLNRKLEEDLLVLTQLEKKQIMAETEKHRQNIEQRIIEVYHLITQRLIITTITQIPTGQNEINTNAIIRHLYSQLVLWLDLGLFDEARDKISADISLFKYIEPEQANSIISLMLMINGRQFSFQRFVSKPNLRWGHQRGKITELRKEVSVLLQQSQSIIKIHENVTNKYIAKLKDIFKYAESMLGIPPVNICIIGYGNICSADATPILPVKFKILVENKNTAVYEYLELFLQIIQVEMLAFRESRFAQTGFYLHTFPKILSTKQLTSIGIETVDEYVKSQRVIISEDATQLSPVRLHGNENLFNACASQLMQYNFSGTNSILGQCLKELSDSTWNKVVKDNQPFNITSDFIQPFTKAIYLLQNFYGIQDLTNKHPLAIIQYFIAKKYWTQEFGNACEAALTYLYIKQMQLTCNSIIDNPQQQEIICWDNQLREIARNVLEPLTKLLEFLTKHGTHDDIIVQIKHFKEKTNYANAHSEFNSYMHVLNLPSAVKQTQSLAKSQLLELITLYKELIPHFLNANIFMYDSYEALLKIIERFLQNEKQRSELWIQYTELLIKKGTYYTSGLLADNLSSAAQRTILLDDVLRFTIGLRDIINAQSIQEVHAPFIGFRSPKSNDNKSPLDQLITDLMIKLQKRLMGVPLQLSQNLELSPFDSSNSQPRAYAIISSEIWISARHELDEHYNAIYKKFMAEIPIEELQKFIRDSLCTFLKNMLKKISIYFDIPFNNLCILLLGSLSRGDPSMDSDLECYVLYKSNNPETLKKIHDMLIIWRAVMELLGGKKNYMAFHFDPSATPKVELGEKFKEKFVEDIEQLNYYSTHYDEDCTRLNPRFLIGNEQLFAELFNKIPDTTDSAMQANFSFDVERLFKETFWQTHNPKRDPTVDIKKHYIQPLVLGLTQLCFFYGVSTKNCNHPFEMIKRMMQGGFLSHEYATAAQQALRYLYRLRIEEQLITHGFKINPTPNKEANLNTIVDQLLKPLEKLLTRVRDGTPPETLRYIDPWYLPQKNGERPITAMQRIDWYTSVKQVLTDEKCDESLPKIVVATTEGAKGYLPAAVVKYLINNGKMTITGQFIAKAKETSDIKGNHNVYRVTTDKGVVYKLFFLKLWPEMAGNEYAAGSLARLLFARGMPWVEIARFNSGNEVYAVLISEGIEGKTLEERLKATPDQSIDIDKLIFGESTIIDIVECPEDKKPDNIVVTLTQFAQALLKLPGMVTVDNERSFYPSLVMNEDFITVVLKSVNLCSTQMKEVIHPAIIDTLLYIDPYLVLQAWLRDIADRDKKIRNLFSENEMKEMFKEESISSLMKKMGVKRDISEQSVLPIPIREGLIPELYVKLKSIQKILKEHRDQNKSITYLELLIALEPYLGRYYKGLLEKHRTITERFNEGPGKMYDQGKKDRLKTRKTVPQTLQTMCGKPIKIEELLAQRNQLATEAMRQLDETHNQYLKVEEIVQGILNGHDDTVTKLRQITADDLKAKIINQLDFSRIKISDEAIISIMENISFRRLRIVNWTTLKDNQLRRILKNSANLQEFTLRNMPLITGDLWGYLGKFCPVVEKLHLDDLPALNWTGRTISLLYLREAFINNCEMLENLYLSAPSLKTLKLQECPALSTGSIAALLQEAEEATKVIIEDCERINRAAIGRVLFQNELFTRFNANLLIDNQCLDIRETTVPSQKLAEILRDHPEVTTIYYSGSKDELMSSQAVLMKECAMIPNIICKELNYDLTPKIEGVGIIKFNEKHFPKKFLLTHHGYLLVTYGSSNKIEVYDTNIHAAFKHVRTITLNENSIGPTLALKDGTVLIYASNYAGKDSKAKFYIVDLTKPIGKEIVFEQKATYDYSLSELLFLSDQKFIAISYVDINMFDLDNPVTFYKGHYSRNTNKLFAIGHGNFEIPPSEKARFQRIPDNFGGISAVTFLGKKRFVCATNSKAEGERNTQAGHIFVWDFEQPIEHECIRIIKDAHNQAITALIALPGEGRFLSGSGNASNTEQQHGEIRLWDLNNPPGNECVKTIFVAKSVVVLRKLPNGKIACGSMQQFLIFDLTLPQGKECIYSNDNIKYLSDMDISIDGRILCLSATSKDNNPILTFPNQNLNSNWIKLFRNNFSLLAQTDHATLTITNFHGMGKALALQALNDAMNCFKLLLQDYQVGINVYPDNMQLIFYCEERSAVRFKLMLLLQNLNQDIIRPVNTTALRQHGFFSRGFVPKQPDEDYALIHDMDENDDDELSYRA